MLGYSEAFRSLDDDVERVDRGKNEHRCCQRNYLIDKVEDHQCREIHEDICFAKFGRNFCSDILGKDEVDEKQDGEISGKKCYECDDCILQ